MRKSFGVGSTPQQRVNGKFYRPKFSQHSKNSSRHNMANSTTKNYSMLKKYLVTNDKIKEDAKYQILKKRYKNGTPQSYSIGGVENSIDSKQLDASQISNRSQADRSGKLQTPRTGVSRKLKALDSKKSDLTDSMYASQQ